MSDALDGKRAIELGKEEVKRRLADGSAYLDVVVKGKWKYEKIGISTCAIVCSECGNTLHRGDNFTDVESFKRFIQTMLLEKDITLDNFCHNCGADMREDGVDATEN